MNKRSAKAKAETIRRRTIRKQRAMTVTDVDVWMNLAELKR